MNIPFPNKTDRAMFFQTQMGNAGNGGRPNPPTIPLNPPASRPRVDLSKDFVIGGYNNQLESFNFPRFSKTWDDKVYSNNPVGFSGWKGAVGGDTGVAGNGDNQNGAGYTPSPWSPYRVESLGVSGGSSQSYPYNKNDLFLDGGTQRVWNNMDNVNEGEPQSVQNGVTPLPSVIEVQAFVAKLKKELDDGNRT